MSEDGILHTQNRTIFGIEAVLAIADRGVRYVGGTTTLNSDTVPMGLNQVRLLRPQDNTAGLGIEPALNN